MSSPAASGRAVTQEIVAHADDALRVVRIVLGVLACFVLGAYRPLAEAPAWGNLALVLGAVALTPLLLNAAARRVPAGRRWAAITQALDVAAVVGLAVLLDEPLGNQSWILLIIPVVSAAVRSGTAASVLSWVGGCIGYIASAAAGIIESTGDVTLLARVPGSLLAVAVTVGLLARWMREGWEIQNELTELAAAREHRLSVIERTGHALHGLPTEQALELTANQLLDLGFDAITIDYPTIDRETFAIGRAELISERPPIDAPLAETHLTVTVWTDAGTIRAHSLSLHEPRTSTLFTAWSTHPIDTERAHASATLIAHASTAIETTARLKQLQRSASQDALTGLANRRTLDQQIEKCAGESGSLSVAFIDLDNFKAINDHHGHAIGDKALVAVARRLEAAVGSAGMVARYGGDEFVVVMPNAGPDQARQLAEAMLQTCSRSVAIGPVTLEVGLSIGVASATTPIRASEILRSADHAVYQAKAAGKGTIVAVRDPVPGEQGRAVVADQRSDEPVPPRT